MAADVSSRAVPADITGINRRFYESLWSMAHLQRPDRFNTWPLVSALLPSSSVRLEIGPGMRPRLPIAGTHFVDLSTRAVEQLSARGGLAVSGEMDSLPFGDRRFDLICAFDVIEHVEDDRRVFTEISRVLKDEGVLIFSVPVHAELWNEFDDWVGHARRYEPAELLELLADHRLTVEKSAAFGMQPASPRLVKHGMWYLQHRPQWAMFWYNWVGMPLALFFQKRLQLIDGLIDTNGVNEMILVCRRV